MLNYFIEKNYKTNRWLERYLLFVDTFQLQSSIKNKTHNHHILPFSLFPEFKSLLKHPFNKAILSHRTHLIAHYMLAKALGNKMWFAYNNMNGHKVKLSTRLYESAQKEIGIMQSTRQIKWLKDNPHPKGMKGKKHSKETKAKISEKSKELVHTDDTKDLMSNRYHNKSELEKKVINKKISISKKGKTHTQITKDKMSKLKKERDLLRLEPIVVSDETKEKISNANKEFYKENDHHTKGKTYEEIMGKGKAEKIKQSKRDKIVTSETRDKISEIHKGKILSEETKELLRNKVPITKDGKNKRVDKELLNDFLLDGWVKGQTRIPEKKFNCPHCNKETNKGNLKRWHGDNCKEKLS